MAIEPLATDGLTPDMPEQQRSEYMPGVDVEQEAAFAAAPVSATRKRSKTGKSGKHRAERRSFSHKVQGDELVAFQQLWQQPEHVIFPQDHAITTARRLRNSGNTKQRRRMRLRMFAAQAVRSMELGSFEPVIENIGTPDEAWSYYRVTVPEKHVRIKVGTMRGTTIIKSGRTISVPETDTITTPHAPYVLTHKDTEAQAHHEQEMYRKRKSI